MNKILLIVSSLFLLISCDDKKVDIKSESEKLMQLSRDWSLKAATGNVDSIVSYWADDAVILTPGAAPIRGISAIRDYVAGAVNTPGFRISWVPLSAVVSASGDMGYIFEENEVTMNDSLGKPSTTYNKGITIWKKQSDGNWKNVVDAWNARPAPEK